MRRLKDRPKTVLVVVDMQRYYLESSSSFIRYSDARWNGITAFILNRCAETVIPNIARLLAAARENGVDVLFFRLCGTAPDRSDLHPSFRELDDMARAAGYPDFYPLQSDPMSEVPPPIAPLPGEAVLCKTTYSAFTSSSVDAWLREHRVERLVFTGLATSQCVETSARDAADRGYEVVHVEDALADYEDITHRASLFASRGVCGGAILSTDDAVRLFTEASR